MNGVTIISTYYDYIYGELLYLIILGIIIVNFIMTTIFLRDICVGRAIIICIISIGLIHFLMYIYPTQKCYKITLDDNVVWGEFNEHYKIIGQYDDVLNVIDRTGN